MSAATLVLAVLAPVGVDVAWPESLECASASDVRGRAAEYLARSREPPAIAVAAEVRVLTDVPTVRASLRLSTAWGHSERELMADTCEELAEAVALVLAITIDPLLPVEPLPRPMHAEVTGPLPPPTLAEPEPEPEPELAPLPPPTAAEPEPAPTPRDDRPAPPVKVPLPRLPRWAVDLWAAPGAGGGLLPTPGLVIEGGLAIRARQWRAGVIAVGWPRQRHALADTEGGTFATRAWSVGALGCGVPTFGRLEIDACGVVMAGRADAEGDGLASDATATRPWVGVGARAGLGVVVARRLSLFVAAEGLGNVLRPQFRVEGLGRVHLAAAVSWRGLIGLRVTLP